MMRGQQSSNSNFNDVPDPKRFGEDPDPDPTLSQVSLVAFKMITKWSNFYLNFLLKNKNLYEDLKVNFQKKIY